MAQVTIDGDDIDASCVTCNHGLNYGRFNFSNMSIHDYSIILQRTDFIRLMSDIYDSCINELKRDDVITGEECELASAGWPSLTALLDIPELAVDTIKTHMDRDTLAAFGFVNTDAKYIINSTDVIEIEAKVIVFHGRCFQRMIE